MSTTLEKEDGTKVIKLNDEEAFELYNAGILPMRPDQFERLKQRLAAKYQEDK